MGITLELRATNLDRVLRSEILLDRCPEPRSSDIELNRTTRKAPPEGSHDEQREPGDSGGNKAELAQPRAPRQVCLSPAQEIRQVAFRGRSRLRVCVAVLRLRTRRSRLAQIRVETFLQLSEGLERNLILLTRHAQTWRPPTITSR